MTQIQLLAKRRFLPLFIVQFFGAFNINLFKQALIILIIYRLTQSIGASSQLVVACIGAIFISALFLFSTTAGQFADKFEKSRLIYFLKLAEIMLAVFAGLGFYFDSITILLLVVTLFSIQETFFSPVKYAILPDQLTSQELLAGNGLIAASTYIAILLGTLMGGYFILMQQGEFIISSGLFCAALVGWLGTVWIPKTTVAHPNLQVNYNFISETANLLRYAKQHWDIFLTILGISWFWLIGIIFLLQLPIFTTEIHGNPSLVILFYILFSIGIATGALLCNSLLRGEVHATFVPAAALGITLFTIDLYFASAHLSKATIELMDITQFYHSFNGWRVTVDIFLISICGGLYSVPLYAMLQERTAASHRGRIIAINNVMNGIFIVFSTLITMLMLKLSLSLSEIFLVLGLANGLVAIYICKLLPEASIKAFLRWILTRIYHVKVIGIENYLNAGNRIVIVANHTSFLDAALLAIFLPDKLTFAIETLTAKKRWVRFFLLMVDAFPLDPTNPMAIKSLIEFVRKDNKCVIFPEGRITMTGSLMKIYEGPGLVADKAGAKLLPLRIQGAQFTPFSRLKGKVRLRWLPKITLTIFPPQPIDIDRELKGRKRRQKISNNLYDLMRDVMFESSDYHQTLFANLLHVKETYGRDLEIIEDIERVPLNYQQLITRSFILSGRIAKATQPGENIGILLPNTIAVAICFFAAQIACRVPAMLNFSTGIKNVIIGCKTAEIKIIYTSHKFIAMANLQEMAAELIQSGVKIVYLEELRASTTLWNKLRGFIFAKFPHLSYQLINYSTRQLIDPNTAAVVLFTSGSEGTPKGVVLSHINILANIYQISACIDFTPSDKVLNALPVFHSFGLTDGMLLPLLSGVKVFCYPSPLHYRIIPELSYAINATILFGTDTFLAGYAKHAHQYDFYSVRYVFSGAEKLRDETRILWSAKFGSRILEGYGATECSPVIAMNSPMQSKVGTVGRLLPGIRYRLTPVPGIETGGILSVAGPNIMKGYLLTDKPGVLQPPPNGWYDTGDIVDIDELGYVSILGRVKRFAKIGGEMVSLTMVEQQVRTLWPEFEHAIVNLPDPKKGEQLVLITTNIAAKREEIISYARSIRMGEIAIPKRILVIDKMFLLGTGKIDYPRLKGWVLEQM